MKTAREVYDGNKNGLDLPLHRLSGWSVRLILSGFYWSLYGGSLLVWLVGLWFAKGPIMDVIRFAWGCLAFILSFAVIVGIIIWLLVLQYTQL